MSDLSQLHSEKNIGDMLKNRREELGLSLDEASQRLRIRLIFLKALEDGRIDQLPGVAYASGFLRAYAELLNLDSDALVKRFRQESQANAEKPKLMFPAPVPQSGIPAGVIVFFSLLIMVGAYIGWYKMSDHHQSPSETIPPPPAQLDQKVGEPQQVSPQIASIMPSEHPVSMSGNENKATSADVNNNKQVGNNPLTPLTDLMRPVSSDQLPQQPSSAPAVTNIIPAETKEPEKPLMIKAIAPSWLQIKDKTGKVLYQKILKTDETWQVPSDQDEVLLTIANPSVVVLQKGDIQSSPLGKKGKALRRFVLNKEKADKLLNPEDGDIKHPSDEGIPQEVKKKPVVSKPVSRSKHDVSADDLNAKQLNR
ncbi:helix-turn-helix domain-containing protein [Commensalibacter papalotli (ex Servin-Garciduenas et al. 2014)]|uniref:Cytoskeleton protein RodZ-like C-terminal domain-containing protein n=1 Tax=Commensalibacter papalotli (ex Servin-Garciduenas et al. 2014) TaxID=1208583 RepID=W7DJH1_9PROT|nr:helix-turn-helix domain-containing protein [Commensalibacter papalotli (ex Servin-Garciduenas et al. 2014)]EUK17497.1 hypothetical protein COMX_09869 [Commensalibacter papalotli (ex Servin-Garciduenas et al. 2014)]